ncbi:hypothetical protein [Delftia sp. PS-11]|uniref:hypothetical protein n=1 Tax=Delftia sp. PS-11 TaxID=2767222 RepID=UPI0024547EF2|nr:hypothetical protein [Delftia sp. PS-11]KAJ8746780.1 hypothetical protein H9T68_01280 [Delftia sp. PS-11]
MKSSIAAPRAVRQILAATLLACAMASPWAAPAAAASAVSAADVTAAVQATPEADLRITYEAMSMGSDGVQRSSIYTNRVYRRKGLLWVEREMPAALQHSHAHGHAHGHGPHAGHAHDEARAAPLSIRRAEDGRVSVEAILTRLRRVISVDLAHHGNVGYGGSFENVYWIVPPAALQAMERVGKPQGGVQRYRSTASEQTTVIDWDMAHQFARRVERRDAHGTERIVVTASRLPAPLAQPWKAIEGYDKGDYSDLLD